MAEARVRCCGRMHTIRLLEGGCLSLVDHPGGIKSSDGVMANVGLKARCTEILTLWRQVLAGKKNLSDLPEGLRKPAKDAIARHRGPLREGYNLLERARRRAEETIRRLVIENRYEVWEERDRYVYAYADPPFLITVLFAGIHGTFPYHPLPVHSVVCEPTVFFEWRNMGHQNRFPRARLFVPLGWYHKIHKRGLSVLDGRVVLAIDEKAGKVAILGQDSRTRVLGMRWVTAPAGWIETARSGMKERRCRRAGTRPGKPASKRWLRRLLETPQETMKSA